MSQQDTRVRHDLVWVVRTVTPIALPVILVLALVVTVLPPTTPTENQPTVIAPKVVSLTPYVMQLPTVDTTPLISPKFQVIRLEKSRVDVNPVILGLKSKESGNLIADKLSAFFVAFAADDSAALQEVGGWFADYSLQDNQVAEVRTQLIHGLVKVFGSKITDTRIELLGTVLNALHDLDALSEEAQLTSDIELALTNQAAENVALPEISSGSGPALPQQGHYKVDYNSPGESEVPDYVLDAPAKTSVGIGWSIIPVLWTFGDIWDLVSTGKGSLIHDSTYYIVETGKYNYLEALQIPGQSQFDFNYIYFSDSPDTIPSKSWEGADASKEFQVFGKPRGYYHGTYVDEQGREHYWWYMILFTWSGAPLDLRVGDKFQLSSAGPLIVIR